MFTNLQSPRPRARRTGSLLHGILKVSSLTKVETTSEEEQAQAMEFGQRWARHDKIVRRNGFANGSGRNSSGSPPSSVPMRNRATLGVMLPTYTIRDTLFYGIENMDISSARYLEMRSRQDDDPVEWLSSENGPCDQDLKGKQKGRSENNELRDHREHIWTIAHEHEYGPASFGGGANGSHSDFEQGRYKRYSRLVPIPAEDSEQPVLLSTKGRSNAQIQATGSGLREEVRPPHEGPDTYIPIIEREPDADEDQGQPPFAPLPGPAPAPVSQGIYGPDSFAESLQGSTVGQNQQEQERAKEDRRACLAKCKKWLFALMALLVVLVVVVLLLVLKKGGGGGGGGGNGGGEGGEEVYFEKGKDVHDEGTHGVTAKSTTSRSTPTAATKVATSTSTTIATTTAATEKLSSTFSALGPTTTPTTGTTVSTPSSSATTGI
ncbi:hypothetical protein BG000_009161 [Podila horticola]|nr:hypothetical protein BG000_009161 [Podila horticola]